MNPLYNAVLAMPQSTTPASPVQPQAPQPVDLNQYMAALQQQYAATQPFVRVGGKKKRGGYEVIPTQGIQTAGPLNPGQNLGGPGHQVYDLTASQANAVAPHAFYAETGPAADYWASVARKKEGK